MSSDGLIVVGDRFEEFLANRTTVGASALLAGDVDPAPGLVVGQGLSDEQLAALPAAPSRVAKELTHKRDPRNVMVGPPQRLADDEFVADLVVHEHNEVLEDHLTGQHIPAIALMEAARQLWTVVTEQFLLAEPGGGRFVVITMGGQFQRYVFPLPTTMHFRVVGREASPVGEMFRTRTTFRQNDADTAIVESEYRVVPERMAAKQESMAARQAIKACLAGVAPTTPVRS